MRKTILILFLAGATILNAADNAGLGGGTPSEASIRELLVVTDARKLVDGMMAQMDMLMQNAAHEATKGEPISPNAQKMMDRGRGEMVSIMRDELSWDKLEPMYIQIYQKSLTQEEVTGMVAFYKTPLGQAVIKKMPVVVQNTMAEMQKKVGPIMQRVQQKQQELVAQIQAENKSRH